MLCPPSSWMLIKVRLFWYIGAILVRCAVPDATNNWQRESNWGLLGASLTAWKSSALTIEMQLLSHSYTDSKYTCTVHTTLHYRERISALTSSSCICRDRRRNAAACWRSNTCLQTTQVWTTSKFLNTSHKITTTSSIVCFHHAMGF